MAKRHPHDPFLKQLREFGLAYPGAHTKSPWPGHLDLAVNDKTFAYLSIEGEPMKISCKLPKTQGAALMLPFTEPTGYGLGKSGWVSAQFKDEDVPPLSMLKQWVDESYRAQAPKKLVAQLATGGEAPAKKSPAKKVAAKKKPAKKAARATGR